MFIPIIIDEEKKDLLIFYNNKIYETWNNDIKKIHLIRYILPTEDLEDLNLLKSKFEYIEKYNFEEITSKYDLKDSIIALIFKNENQVRILSRITVNGEIKLKNQSFDNINFDNKEEIDLIIDYLKTIYEDHWKKYNQINTSIKLNLSIKIENNNNLRISEFEKILSETDLIYDFNISKFDKDYTYYQIIFNGRPDVFLKKMSDKNQNFNTQNKVWVLK